MSCVSLSLSTLPIFTPCLRFPQQPLQILPISFHSHNSRKVNVLACQTNQNLRKSSPTEKSIAELGSSRGTSPPKGVPRKLPSKDLKKKIAIVSFLGALGFFLSTRVHFFGVPSKDHCAHALPSEEVQHNGKATLVEFDAELFEVGGN